MGKGVSRKNSPINFSKLYHIIAKTQVKNSISVKFSQKNLPRTSRKIIRKQIFIKIVIFSLFFLEI